MGSSTLYWLKDTLPHNTNFISVENTYNWYQICIAKARDILKFDKEIYSETFWQQDDINNFLKALKPSHVTTELSRLQNWQDQMALGPFYGFHPNAKSRFSGKLGIMWPIICPIIKLFIKLHYKINKKSGPVNCEWQAISNSGDIIFRNISPSIKDQFGEAPNITDYIDAGLCDIKKLLKSGEKIKALFVIDGGPRHYILQEILVLEDKYKNFEPTIYFCDAYRLVYEEIFDLRPFAEFLKGTNKTQKGEPVAIDNPIEAAKYTINQIHTAEKYAEKEIWFYKKKRDFINKH